MNTKSILPSSLLALLAFAAAIWFFGSRNVRTPAGYVGYIQKKPVFAKAEFIGLQVGPTSSGLGWRLSGVNVSVTPYTESEVWGGGDCAYARDKLAIGLSAHLVWKLRPEKVKDFMENYGGLEENEKSDEIAKEAYEHFIKQPFRTTCRAEISKYDGLEISDNLPVINEELLATVNERLKDTPFLVLSTVIGSCNPPQTVLDQIAMKIAVTQELARKHTEFEIAEKNFQIQEATGKASAIRMVEEARGNAEGIKVITATLSPEYIRYKAVSAIEGAQRVYVPLGTNGLPLVGTIGVEK